MGRRGSSRPLKGRVSAATILMTAAAAFLALALAAPMQAPATTPAATEGDAARHLVFLAEQRPVFVRLRITSGDRPFEASWIDAIRALHASLDRNGDGKLTTKEVDDKTFAALLRLATGAGNSPTIAAMDVAPKDDIISVDELAEALRPILGPFRLDFRRQSTGRTDALFDQLDRDKDGALTRPELSAIAGSLRPLDLDDDEMIGSYELESFNGSESAALMDRAAGRRSQFTGIAPVIEVPAGESPLRFARLLIRKYDRAKEDGARERPDDKLSPEEFAVDPDAFARADSNKDGALDARELQKFLARAPIDLTLDLTVSPDASGQSTVRAAAGEAKSEKAQVRQLADGDVEFGVGQVRLDIRVEGRDTTTEAVRQILTQRFKFADANKDGYIEGKERPMLEAPRSALAGLWPVIDRDGDGKVYLKELLAFGDRQAEVARHRLVLTTDDQARAIFGILDTDRDRRLGTREVMRTVDRVMTWDRDGDGQISPDEIPYHFLVTISRSGLPGLTGGPILAAPAARSMAVAQPAGPSAGPDWFQKMDSNQDGDVSRREFLGPRDQFERLDRDKDGLIDPDEARAGAPAKAKDTSPSASRS
jgi:Ca2+-binding EF-hand superfamily protein